MTTRGLIDRLLRLPIHPSELNALTKLLNYPYHEYLPIIKAICTGSLSASDLNPLFNDDIKHLRELNYNDTDVLSMLLARVNGTAIVEEVSFIAKALLEGKIQRYNKSTPRVGDDAGIDVDALLDGYYSQLYLRSNSIAFDDNYSEVPGQILDAKDEQIKAAKRVLAREQALIGEEVSKW